MFTVIFGRPRVPLLRACKRVGGKTEQRTRRFSTTAILIIHAEGITKADLEKTVGKPVETVPQIFVDQKHIGGCTDFEAWAKENLNLFA